MITEIVQGGLFHEKSLVLLMSLLLVILSNTAVFACYGAAAFGMGGAYTAVADDTLAIYWNQAGLAFADSDYGASFTLTTPEDQTNYNSFTAAYAKYGNVTYGVGMTRLAPWAGNETWLTLAAGYPINENWAIGGAVRSVTGTEPYDYESQGFDLSAQYRKDIYRFGLLVQDVGGPSDTNMYWQNVRPSVAIETDKVTMAIDIYMANNLDDVIMGKDEYYSNQAGIEYRSQGKESPLKLRTGFYHGLVTVGGGYTINDVTVDMVYIPDWAATQITFGYKF